MIKIDTVSGKEESARFLSEYFRSCVSRFFKILPLWEEGDQTLPQYMESLQSEIMGCAALLKEKSVYPECMELVSILQFFIDNPECEKKKVRREVFHCISVCNKMVARYDDGKGGDAHGNI